jgi:hypothetical protein
MGNSAHTLLNFAVSLKQPVLEHVNKLLAALETPWQSLHLTVSTKGEKLKGSGQNVKHVTQVIHLVCASWLQTRHFRRLWGAADGYYPANTGTVNFIPHVLRALAGQAQSNALVFAGSSFTDAESMSRMSEVLLGSRRSAWLLFHGGFNMGGVSMCIPNRHATSHHMESHLDFCLWCISNTRFETCHGRNRMAMAHCNHSHPEVTMMETVNIMASLEFLAAEGGQSAELQSILSKSTNIHTYAGDHGSLVLQTVPKRQLADVNVRCEKIQPYFPPFMGGQETVVGKSVKGFVLHERELYARDIDVGKFYTARIRDLDVIVKVNECVVIDIAGSSHFLIGGTQLLSTGNFQFNHYPVLQMHTEIMFPASFILKPAHVVHNCDAGCVRTGVLRLDPAIISRDDVLYGMADSHVTHNYGNVTYLYNPFYLK